FAGILNRNLGTWAEARLECLAVTITFNCHRCEKKLKAADALAGRKTKCKCCGLVMVIPGTHDGRAAAPDPGASGPPADAPPFRKIGLGLPAGVAGVVPLPAWLPLLLLSVGLLLRAQDLTREDRLSMLGGAVFFSIPLVPLGVWFLVGMYRAWAHVISWS